MIRILSFCVLLGMPVFAVDLNSEKNTTGQEGAVGKACHGRKFSGSQTRKILKKLEHLKQFLLTQSLWEHTLLSGRYTLQEKLSPLTQHGVFVHLTDVFPKEGVLIPGSKLVSEDGKVYLPDFKTLPNIRHTLHGTIDKTFEPHDLNPGNYPFAVMFPVKYILSRLNYGCEEDVMVLGPIKFLPWEGVSILCPETYGKRISIRDKKNLNIVPYDEEECSVREAVNRHLHEYYGRPVIKPFKASELELFKCSTEGIKDGAATIIKDDAGNIESMWAPKCYFSKEDLNPSSEIGTIRFSELGKELKKFVPIEGPGFVFLLEPEKRPYISYDMEGSKRLIFKKSIKVNGKNFYPEEYFKNVLKVDLKWCHHDETAYFALEEALLPLTDLLHGPLLGKETLSIESYQEEVLSQCKDVAPACRESINNENVWQVARDIFRKSVPNMLEKLDFFDAEEEKNAQKIVPLSEKEGVLESIKTFVKDAKVFIKKTDLLYEQLVKRDFEVLFDVHEKIKRLQNKNTD